MKEVAYTVGNHPQLVGVYTESQEQKNQLPTILLINSGLLPHIGPFRLYVRLARKFAQMGFNTFRFDLSGIGDSERHADDRLHDERHMGDIRSVMDFLGNKHKDERFIVLGICTGADNAHKAMVMDERVTGAVSIDGYIYPTLRYYFNIYAPKLLRLQSWTTFTKMTFKKLTSFVKPRQEQLPQSFEYRWALPSKGKTEADYKQFIERNVDLLCVFTGSWHCNYEGQLADVFNNIQFGGNIQTAYLENAEHTFPLAEDRNSLTSTIVDWLNSRFIQTSA